MKKLFEIMEMGEFSVKEYAVASVACIVFVILCGFGGWLNSL